MSGLSWLIRSLQAGFNERLRRIRDAQLARAKERAHQKAIEWNARTSEIKKWQAENMKGMCPCCECRHCCCKGPVTDRLIVQILRRLSGISTPHSMPRNELWHRGKSLVGFQVCGPAMWDNAVRAVEEDQ